MFQDPINNRPVNAPEIPFSPVQLGEFDPSGGPQPSMMNDPSLVNPTGPSELLGPDPWGDPPLALPAEMPSEGLVPGRPGRPDPSPRFPDANRVRNRNEMKRDWARRQTANDRLESDRAQMQMEQERLESERTGGPRVAPQFNRRPRGSAAFRPVNRLW